MGYSVKLHPNAVTFFGGLDEITRDRIKSALKHLEINPFKSRSKTDIKKLKGTKGRHDMYRLRVGGFKVIYSVESDTIWVTEIITREKGYKWL
jgi:mRNA interferase RelE/StbE